jgi:hypothetical protein
LKGVFCFKKFEKINSQKFAKNSGKEEKEFAKSDWIKGYDRIRINSRENVIEKGKA